MTKIIITQEQLDRFKGNKDWAVVDKVLDQLSESVLLRYEDGIMTEKEVKILDINKNVIATFEYEIKA